MKKRKKSLFSLLFLGVFLFTTSCGYILYPERRDRYGGGRLDVAVVVMDLLWLIPGVVPGVVALVVDALTGAWFEDGASMFAVKSRTKNPRVLVASRPHQINIKHPLKKPGEVSLYHVDSRGHRTLLGRQNARPGKKLPFRFTLSPSLRGDRGWLLLSLNEKDTSWMDIQVASR